VREALLSQPLEGKGTLRERLAISADTSSKDAAQDAHGGVELASGFAFTASDWLPASSPAVLLGQRANGKIGTSVSRRAVLPIASVNDLLEAASVACEPIIQIPSANDNPARVLYVPGLIGPSSRSDKERPNWHEPLLVAALKHLTAKFAPRSDNSHAIFTERLPILLYHRITTDSSASLSRYRVTPEAFEEQLSYLKSTDYNSVRLEDWLVAMETKKPLTGKAVLITFDDGYLDFLTHALPLLKRFGFTATVFLVANEIGGSNNWDRAFAEKVPLLGWNEISRLQDEGVDFGSHSASHRPLTGLTPEEVVREAARSRAILQRGLGMPVTAFAYPYGAEDRVVQHLVGGSGYILGLSTRQGLSGLHDRLLSLPRVEVTGTDSLQEFIAKLSPS
jgi:peptidoglycan/xylan/chitin deacetylase (PgdA/CDA1 family)